MVTTHWIDLGFFYFIVALFLDLKKNFRSKFFILKFFLSYKCFGPILLWCCFVFVLIVVLVIEIVDQKRFGLQNCCVQKKCCPKTLRPNWVSNSWDIPDLDKSYGDSWHLLKMVPGTYFWSLVKFRWLTADMDKCCQDKYYLDKCRHDRSLQFKMVPWIYF